MIHEDNTMKGTIFTYFLIHNTFSDLDLHEDCDKKSLIEESLQNIHLIFRETLLWGSSLVPWCNMIVDLSKIVY